MAGSPVIGAWIAHLVFWGLMIYGWTELGTKRRVVFLLLWLAGSVARSFVPQGPFLFAVFVAVLDIVLVFLILGRDVRIS